jgi:hypothetical protein
LREVRKNNRVKPRGGTDSTYTIKSPFLHLRGFSNCRGFAKGCIFPGLYFFLKFPGLLVIPYFEKSFADVAEKFSLFMIGTCLLSQNQGLLEEIN